MSEENQIIQLSECQDQNNKGNDINLLGKSMKKWNFFFISRISLESRDVYVDVTTQAHKAKGCSN